MCQHLVLEEEIVNLIRGTEYDCGDSPKEPWVLRLHERRMEGKLAKWCMSTQLYECMSPVTPEEAL